MPQTSTRPITAQELLELGDIGPCELVSGQIIHMAPAGFDHGDIALRLAVQIAAHVRKLKLGKVVAAETGFLLTRDPDTVRAPDVAFIKKTRVPRRPHPLFFEGAPDLAIEVLSPSDRLSEMRAKADQWLAAGAQSVWIVDPANCTVTIHRAGKTIHYTRSDLITDEPTLPGLTLRLDELFQGD